MKLQRIAEITDGLDMTKDLVILENIEKDYTIIFANRKVKLQKITEDIKGTSRLFALTFVHEKTTTSRIF